MDQKSKSRKTSFVKKITAILMFFFKKSKLFSQHVSGKILCNLNIHRTHYLKNEMVIYCSVKVGIVIISLRLDYANND